MKPNQNQNPATEAGFNNENVKYSIVEVYPSTVKELALQYRVDYRTFTRWIEKFEYKVGQRVGRYYSVKQVEIIIECLGAPYEVGEVEPEKDKGAKKI